eukprot:TRINITY_DN4985_c1_g1_i1.p1 TRINITY_DN4985_c1_g1~~TRINITY_DN4985_c1_g1_i1.p1  ORF type:complete len:1613 (+),score=358.11 TRINITY_DN4985_c1_g1_i1:132-4970(+)
MVLIARLSARGDTRFGSRDEASTRLSARGDARGGGPRDEDRHRSRSPRQGGGLRLKAAPSAADTEMRRSPCRRSMDRGGRGRGSACARSDGPRRLSRNRSPIPRGGSGVGDGINGRSSNRHGDQSPRGQREGSGQRRESPPRGLVRRGRSARRSPRRKQGEANGTPDGRDREARKEAMQRNAPLEKLKQRTSNDGDEEVGGRGGATENREVQPQSRVVRLSPRRCRGSPPGATAGLLRRRGSPRDRGRGWRGGIDDNGRPASPQQGPASPEGAAREARSPRGGGGAPSDRSPGRGSGNREGTRAVSPRADRGRRRSGGRRSRSTGPVTVATLRKRRPDCEVSRDAAADEPAVARSKGGKRRKASAKECLVSAQRLPQESSRHRSASDDAPVDPAAIEAVARMLPGCAPKARGRPPQPRSPVGGSCGSSHAPRQDSPGQGANGAQGNVGSPQQQPQRGRRKEGRSPSRTSPPRTKNGENEAPLARRGGGTGRRGDGKRIKRSSRNNIASTPRLAAAADPVGGDGGSEPGTVIRTLVKRRVRRRKSQVLGANVGSASSAAAVAPRVEDRQQAAGTCDDAVVEAAGAGGGFLGSEHVAALEHHVHGHGFRRRRAREAGATSGGGGSVRRRRIRASSWQRHSGGVGTGLAESQGGGVGEGGADAEAPRERRVHQSRHSGQGDERRRSLGVADQEAVGHRQQRRVRREVRDQQRAAAARAAAEAMEAVPVVKSRRRSGQGEGDEELDEAEGTPDVVDVDDQGASEANEPADGSEDDDVAKARTTGQPAGIDRTTVDSPAAADEEEDEAAEEEGDGDADSNVTRPDEEDGGGSERLTTEQPARPASRREDEEVASEKSEDDAEQVDGAVVTPADGTVTSGVNGEGVDPKVYARVHELISRVYSRQNPAKLTEVDQLLMKYRGAEKEVYKRICEKYGEPLEEVNVASASERERAGDSGSPQRSSPSAPHVRSRRRAGSGTRGSAAETRGGRRRGAGGGRRERRDRGRHRDGRDGATGDRHHRGERRGDRDRDRDRGDRDPRDRDRDRVRDRDRGSAAAVAAAAVAAAAARGRGGASNVATVGRSQSCRSEGSQSGGGQSGSAQSGDASVGHGELASRAAAAAEAFRVIAGVPVSPPLKGRSAQAPPPAPTHVAGPKAPPKGFAKKASAPPPPDGGRRPAMMGRERSPSGNERRSRGDRGGESADAEADGATEGERAFASVGVDGDGDTAERGNEDRDTGAWPFTGEIFSENSPSSEYSSSSSSDFEDVEDVKAAEARGEDLSEGDADGDISDCSEEDASSEEEGEEDDAASDEDDDDDDSDDDDAASDLGSADLADPGRRLAAAAAAAAASLGRRPAGDSQRSIAAAAAGRSPTAEDKDDNDLLQRYSLIFGSEGPRSSGRDGAEGKASSSRQASASQSSSATNVVAQAVAAGGCAPILGVSGTQSPSQNQQQSQELSKPQQQAELPPPQSPSEQPQPSSVETPQASSSSFLVPGAVGAGGGPDGPPGDWGPPPAVVQMPSLVPPVLGQPALVPPPAHRQMPLGPCPPRPSGGISSPWGGGDLVSTSFAKHGQRPPDLADASWMTHSQGLATPAAWLPHGPTQPCVAAPGVGVGDAWNI